MAFVGESGDVKPAQAALLDTLTTCDFQTLSLRDFHAENMIWLPDRAGLHKVGLLDFQDAMIGPRGYDLASLLMDARRDVSPEVIEIILAEYANRTQQSRETVGRIYAILGAQRNLRILGIFVRLAMNMGRTRYLDFLPRVWGYVETSLSHPALDDLAKVVLRDLPKPSADLIEDLRERCGTRQKPL